MGARNAPGDRRFPEDEEEDFADTCFGLQQARILGLLDYELSSSLARAAWAEVTGDGSDADRFVAIKLIAPAFDSKGAKRCPRSRGAAISHENVVQICSVEVDGFLLVMEYVPGSPATKDRQQGAARARDLRIGQQTGGTGGSAAQVIIAISAANILLEMAGSRQDYRLRPGPQVDDAASHKAEFWPARLSTWRPSRRVGKPRIIASISSATGAFSTLCARADRRSAPTPPWPCCDR